jgi:hypothetical protein
MLHSVDRENNNNYDVVTCQTTTSGKFDGGRHDFYPSGLVLPSVGVILKPHCTQSSRVLVPADTSKSTLRRHDVHC